MLKETPVLHAENLNEMNLSDSELPSKSLALHDTDSSPHQPSVSTASFQEVSLDSPSSPQAAAPPPLPKSPVQEKEKEFVSAELNNPRVPPPLPHEPVRPIPSSQPRSASLSSNVSTHHRSLTMSQGSTLSTVFITSALETIASSKEAKKQPELRDSVQHALDMIKVGQGGDRPRQIFEPLRLACETRSEKLMIASLDCISKLISHSFFIENTPFSQGQTPPASLDTITPSDNLADLVANTITSAYTESTPDPVALQIVKALLALVLSPTILIHHSSLLKAVRTVYNVFLLSQDSVNQMVAQGGLTQIIHHVFTRCKPSETSGSKSNGSTESVSSLRRDSVIQSPRFPLVKSPQAESYVQRSEDTKTSIQINRTSSIESASETASTSQTVVSAKGAEIEMIFQNDTVTSGASRVETNGTSPARLGKIQDPQGAVTL